MHFTLVIGRRTFVLQSKPQMEHHHGRQDTTIKYPTTLHGRHTQQHMGCSDNATCYSDYCLLIVLGQQLFIYSRPLAQGPTYTASEDDCPKNKGLILQVLQSTGGRELPCPAP